MRVSLTSRVRRGAVAAAIAFVLAASACTADPSPGVIGSSSVVEEPSGTATPVTPVAIATATGMRKIDGIDLGFLPIVDRPNRERLNHPLIGKSFRSVSATGHELLPASPLTMSVGVEQIDLSVGCNDLTGRAEITGTTISLGTFRTTAVGCGAEIGAQEEWFPTFLEDAGYVLNGRTMVLTSGTVTVTFEQTNSSDAPPAKSPGWWVVDDLVVDGVGRAVRGLADPTPLGSLLFYIDPGSVAIYGEFCGRVSARSTPVSKTFPEQRRVAAFGIVQGSAGDDCADDIAEAMEVVEFVLSGPLTFHRDGWWLDVDTGDGVTLSMHREF